jgi:succinate-semialdehyde dehydrogenase/glutarate-semialdehyde dehydrogenase
MGAMKIGDPTLEDTEIGPLATTAQVNDVHAQVQAAIKAGGRVLTGGERTLGKGNYYKPTVLTGVPRTSEVYREEIFGPVAMLFRVRDIDDAIAVANDTPFGLGASVWTRSEAEQRRFAADLQCGAVFVNAPVASDPRVPFGGVKHSGYGRELSAAGMREFLNAKTVVIAEPVAAKRPEPAAEPAIRATGTDSGDRTPIPFRGIAERSVESHK